MSDTNEKIIDSSKEAWNRALMSLSLYINSEDTKKDELAHRLVHNFQEYTQLAGYDLPNSTKIKKSQPSSKMKSLAKKMKQTRHYIHLGEVKLKQLMDSRCKSSLYKAPQQHIDDTKDKLEKLNLILIRLQKEYDDEENVNSKDIA